MKVIYTHEQKRKRPRPPLNEGDTDRRQENGQNEPDATILNHKKEAVSPPIAMAVARRTP